MYKINRSNSADVFHRVPRIVWSQKKSCSCKVEIWFCFSNIFDIIFLVKLMANYKRKALLLGPYIELIIEFDFSLEILRFM